MLPAGLEQRLATQLDAVLQRVRTAQAEAVAWRPPTSQWSAHENLAHLGRMHEVMRERLERILAEDRPALSRYRAEEDAAWPDWQALATSEILERVIALRRQLGGRIAALSDAELARVGVHSRLGAMDVPAWLEFFLLHEAHHLYVILIRLAEARGAS